MSAVLKLVFRKSLSSVRVAATIVLFTLIRYMFGILVIGAGLYGIDFLLGQHQSLNFIQHVYRAFLAFISAILAFLKMIFFQLIGNQSQANLNSQLLQLSVLSLVGHLFVSMLSSVLDPLFLVLRVGNLLFAPFLTKSGEDAAINYVNGVPYPTTCKNGIPNWQLKDTIFITGIGETLQPIFDFKFTVKVCAYITINDGPGLAINPTDAEIGDNWICSSVSTQTVGEVFGLSTWWDNMVSRRLVPAKTFTFIADYMEDSVTSVFGDHSGLRLFEHHIGLNRLETDNSGTITDKGDQPFNNFIKDRLAMGYGCPTEEN